MYDVIVNEYAEWDELVRQDLGLIVDPLIYRMGQFFLEGQKAARAESEVRWNAISQDLTSLVTFLDMIVLHDRLPAINYSDAFGGTGSIASLQDALNAYSKDPKDKVLWHVDVEHQVYRDVKARAITQLKQELAKGPFVSSVAASSMLATLSAVQYDWRPSLDQLGDQLRSPDERRLGQFLLGQLVFSGYAQLTGSPHVVGPRRSTFLVAAGLQKTTGDSLSESALYDELRRRLRDAGHTWRDVEAPWTPSFVPYLLSTMNPYRQGPEELVKRALDLRGNKAVQQYRTLRRQVLSVNPSESAEAYKQLADAAEEVALSLAKGRRELEITKSIFVELLPQAAGAVAGGLLGAGDGPAEALAGAVLGKVAGDAAGDAVELALGVVQNQLWCWTVDRLPCRRVAKLLTRTVMAEHKMRNDLEKQLHATWETGPR